MGDPLRERRAVAELAANRQVIDFSHKIKDFERFSAAIEADLRAVARAKLLADATAHAVVGRLVFRAADAAGVAAELSGSIATRVTSVCQRCLNVFEWPLDVTLALDLVEPGQAPAEREGFESWELESASVRPVDIVDEALVMALPLSPRHEDSAACAEIESPGKGEETIRPFADLRARMDDDRKD